MCWSFVLRKKPVFGYPLFWTFPSDRTPKATKDSTYISLFTLAIPIIPPSSGNFSKLLRTQHVVFCVFEASSTILNGHVLRVSGNKVLSKMS